MTHALGDKEAPFVTVIIVNFNGGEYPAAALKSLAAQSYRQFEVIFLDNASSDSSCENLPTDGLPDFSFIQSEENLGFAAGNNLAAKQAKGEWLALLNPDAEADPNWLLNFVSATERYPDTAMFASAQYSAGDKQVMDGAGDAYLLFGMPWRGGFGRPISEMPTEDGTCFSPCGAGAFYRADEFDELGGFDERFFCYCEDVDIGFRFRLLGHNCVLLPDARIDHWGGKLSEKVSEFAVYHGTRNRIWTYVKNMPLWLLVLTLPVHVALTLYVLGHSAFLGRFKATLRGLKDGIAGCGEMRSSRLPLSGSLKQLLLSMAWNPWKMHVRHVHVRRLQKH